MAFPRRLIPGATYLVTRRCSHRQCLLRPDAATNQILRYCLAVATKRHGLLVHAVCVMSNHIHLVLTDPRCEISKFAQWLHKYSAKCMNKFRGRRENFWSSIGSFSAVRLYSDVDFLRKLVYVCGNPVKSGLVAYGAQWPGVRFSVGGVGAQSFTVEKPGVYFSRIDSLSMPAEASFTVSRHPEFFADLPDDEFEEKVRGAVGSYEEAIRERFKREGRQFLGRAAILAQSPFAFPKGLSNRSPINPRVACADPWQRAEALQRLKSFLEAHADALRRWVAGDRNVVFPFGTYWMRVFHRANCAPAPA